LNNSANAMPPMAAATNPSSVVCKVVSSDRDSTGQSLTRVRKTAPGPGNT
jgi:hypothetical protein